MILKDYQEFNQYKDIVDQEPLPLEKNFVTVLVKKHQNQLKKLKRRGIKKIKNETKKLKILLNH